MKTIRTFLVAAALLTVPALAQDVLITPTAITSSTAGTDFFPAVNLINGSGLSGTPTLAALGTHAAAAADTAWVTTGAFPADYFPAFPAPVLTCTLPRPQYVTELILWGYHFGGGNGNEGRVFDVAFSKDGADFGDTVTVTSPALQVSGALRLAFPGGARLATHVRVTITDNHFPTAGGDRVGLGELRFAGQPAYVVMNFSDSGPGSLRDTLAAAPSGSALVFDPALDFGYIYLASRLDIDKDVTIDATDLGVLGLRPQDTGANDFRILQVGPFNVGLTGIEIAEGRGDEGGGLQNHGTLTLTRMTFVGNRATMNGGAIFNAGTAGATITATDCFFWNNRSAGSGGAILNQGTLVVNTSTFENNATDDTVGGSGGAIHNINGTVALHRCTLSRNIARTNGGGIASTTAATAGASVTLDRCTLAENTATTGAGGGIYNAQGDPGTGDVILTLTHCTVSANSATTGGGIQNSAGPRALLHLSRSIVAANTGTVPEVDGTLTTDLNNLTSGDPLLAPVSAYGGPTATMALKLGSPARGAAAGSPITSDQRGFPIVGPPDIGAYEAGNPANFAAWAFELLGSSSSTTDDHDNDGQGALREYATRTDPLAFNADPFGLPNPVSGPAYRFTFPYRPAATEVSYVVERSPDLVVWTEIYRADLTAGVITEVSPVAAIEDASAQTITLTDPAFSLPQCFWRLNVLPRRR